jgi:hypothetical protein
LTGVVENIGLFSFNKLRDIGFNGFAGSQIIQQVVCQ